MVRRSLAVLAAALLLAGCALRSPEQPSPSGVPAAVGSRPVVRVGSDGTTTGEVLSQLYAKVLTAGGVAATVTRAPEGMAEVLPGVAAGDPAVLPVFARTACQQLSTEEVPADADGVVAQLADALDLTALVLDPAAVEGEPTYVTTGRVAGDSLSGLDRVTGTVRVGLPAALAHAPAGPDGLRTAYHLRVAVQVIDDPALRYRALREGRIQLAAFLPVEPRPTDADVRPLADPDGLLQPDPLVALINLTLAADPVAVGRLRALHQVLTSADVARISAAADAEGAPAAVAEWLTERGLGR